MKYFFCQPYIGSRLHFAFRLQPALSRKDRQCHKQPGKILRRYIPGKPEHPAIQLPFTVQDLTFPAQGHSVLPKELIEWCQRAFGKAAFHMEICLSAKCSRKRNQETQSRSALSGWKKGFFRLFLFCDRCNPQFFLSRPDIGPKCIQAVSCRPYVP